MQAFNSIWLRDRKDELNKNSSPITNANGSSKAANTRGRNKKRKSGPENEPVPGASGFQVHPNAQNGKKGIKDKM